MTKLLTTLAIFALTLSSLAAADTRTFVCEYNSLASPDGVQKVKKGDFVLTFIIDDETQKAYMLGNIGTEEVAMSVSEDSINFIEETAVGNIMLTTIAKGGFSVHSRHSMILGEAVPSQYYGHCVNS